MFVEKSSLFSLSSRVKLTDNDDNNTTDRLPVSKGRMNALGGKEFKRAIV